MSNKKFILITLIVLTTLFYTTYRIVDMKIERNNNVTTNVTNTVEGLNKKGLNKKSSILLYEGEKLKEKLTLEEAKEKFGLKGNITKETLIKGLAEQGYDFEEKTGNDLCFLQAVNSNVKPNKYYISDYEGYLAIYRSDNYCKLTIENLATDVYKDCKKINELPEADKKIIQDYQLEYDNKEEAQLDITELIS